MRAPLAALVLGAQLVAVTARAGGDPLEAVERRQQEIFEQLGPSVVFISSSEGFGSGFFVGGDGLILTSAHVVGHDAKVKIVLADARRLEAQVVERGADSIDLALVQVAEKDRADLPAPLPLEAHPELRVGSWVAAVGHGSGGIWSFNTGMVSNIYPEGGARPVFQTQIPLNPGNSGGPIVDRAGRVVGVVTAGIRDSNSINFAIRIEVALQSLSRLDALGHTLAITAPPGVAIFVDGKMAGKGPRVVVLADKRAYEVFAVIGGEMKKVKVRFPEQRTVELK